MTYKYFKNNMRGMCRRCINKQLGIHFKHKHCEYWNFPETCGSCGETRNIVTGLHPLSRFRVWFLKKPVSLEAVTQAVEEPAKKTKSKNNKKKKK